MARYTSALFAVFAAASAKSSISRARMLHAQVRVRQAPLRPRTALRRAAARFPTAASSCARSRSARAIYGMLERSSAKLLRGSRAPTTASPVRYLLRTLELRLDNVVYRLGFADSRAQARQIVSHGHIAVNGRKSTIPIPDPEGRTMSSA